METVTKKKSRVDQTPFYTFHTFYTAFFIDIYTLSPFQKNRDMDTKGVDSQKSQCICPQSFKTVFMNMVKKSQLMESTLSRISLFSIQAQEKVGDSASYILTLLSGEQPVKS
jgi:hypothetical protein